MEDFTTNGSSSAVEQRQIWPWQQHAILNNIGFLKKKLQYYHHATPGEPYRRVPSKEPILFRVGLQLASISCKRAGALVQCLLGKSGIAGSTSDLQVSKKQNVSSPLVKIQYCGENRGDLEVECSATDRQDSVISPSSGGSPGPV